MTLMLPLLVVLLASVMWLGQLRCYFRIAFSTLKRIVISVLFRKLMRVGINKVKRAMSRISRWEKDQWQRLRDETWLFRSRQHFKVWFTGRNRFPRWGQTAIVVAIIVMALAAIFDWTIPEIPLIAKTAIGGTTYYYSQSLGDDGNDGLYPTDEGGGNGPKQSIPDTSGTGNDEYYFRRGDTWTITVNAYSWNQSGTGSSTPVTYGAYGSGDRPIFDGDTARQDCYWAHAGDYMVTENIEFKQFDGDSVVYSAGCHDWVIDNCYIHHTNSFAIGLEGSTTTYDVEIKNCTFDENGVDPGMGGVYVRGLGNAGGGPYGLVYNITFHDNDMTNSYGDMITYHNGGSFPYNNCGAGCKIYNCLFDTADDDTVDCNTGDDLEVYDNEVTGWGEANGNQGIDWDGTSYGKCYRNYIHDKGANGLQALRITTPNTEAWGNLIIDYDSANSGVVWIGNSATQAIEGEDTGSGPVRYAHDISFIKNTVIYSGTTSGYNLKVSDEYGSTLGSSYNLENLEVSSNIFSYDDDGSYVSYYLCFEYTSPNSSEYTFDKNVYGPKAFTARDEPNSDASRNWSYWTSTLGHDANGANEDPDFTNRTGGDYTLTSDSPAIGLGPATGTYSPDIRNSSYITGDAINSQDDAGAYEYDSGAVATTEIINITLTNMSITV